MHCPLLEHLRLKIRIEWRHFLTRPSCCDGLNGVLPPSCTFCPIWKLFVYPNVIGLQQLQYTHHSLTHRSTLLMATWPPMNKTATKVRSITLLTDLKYDLYTRNPTDPIIWVSLLLSCSCGLALTVVSIIWNEFSLLQNRSVNGVANGKLH